MDDLMQPPLPESWTDEDGNPLTSTLYTADQMREYAKRATEAEREACAGLRKEIVLLGGLPTEYEEGFWDALEKYEDALRARSQS